MSFKPGPRTIQNPASVPEGNLRFPPAVATFSPPCFFLDRLAVLCNDNTVLQRINALFCLKDGPRTP